MERQKRTGKTGQIYQAGKTGHPLWVEEKARIRAFFFHARRFHFFRALFSSRFQALFFASRSRARKREKSSRRPPLQIANYKKQLEIVTISISLER